MRRKVNLEYIEVSDSDRKILLEKRRIFNLFSQHVGKVYYSHLDITRIGIIGIKIRLSRNIEKTFLPTKSYAVISFNEIFDYESFYNQTEEKEKQKMILDVILKVTLKVSDIYEWDKEMLTRTYKKVLEEYLPVLHPIIANEKSLGLKKK